MRTSRAKMRGWREKEGAEKERRTGGETRWSKTKPKPDGSAAGERDAAVAVLLPLFVVPVRTVTSSPLRLGVAFQSSARCQPPTRTIIILFFFSFSVS